MLSPPVVAPATPGPGTVTLSGDAAHRNAWTGTGLRPPLERAWSVAADPASAPVVAGSRVIVATATAVSAYDAATGAKAWSDPAPELAELATDGTRVFITTRSAVAALDAATGKTVWVQTTGGSGPAVAAGKLWTGTATGAVRGYDAATGAVAVTATTDIAGARPAISGSRVFVTSSCDAYAIDARNGLLIWHSGTCAAPVAVPTLLTGTSVVAVDHAIYAAGDGTLGFSGPAPGTVGAGLLFRSPLATHPAQLDAVDASTFRLRWSWTPPLGAHLLLRPAVTDATVWQVVDAGGDGLVLGGLDAATGKELWSGFLPRPGTLAATAGSAVSVAPGLLLVPAAGGRLVALRNATAGPLGVSAQVPQNVVAAGTDVPVTGTLTGNGHGLVGPRPVFLGADVFPFEGKYATLGAVESRRKGFALTARITRNTRLRLSADGVTYAPTEVYATLPLSVVYARTRHKLVVDATLRIKAEPGLRRRGGRVALYRVRRHGSAAQRLGTGRADAAGVARFTVHIPATLQRSDRILPCLRGASRQGYGAPNVLDAHCGDRRIAIPAAAQSSALERRSLSTGTGSAMPLKRLWPASEKP